MRIYELNSEFFTAIKEKLSGQIFWRISEKNTVYVKMVIPHKSLQSFLDRVCISNFEDLEE